MKIALWVCGWSDSVNEDVDISPKMNVCCWFYSQNENSIVWMRMWIFLPKWMCVVDFILKMKIALWVCGWSDSMNEDVDISPKMNVCCWFYSQNENSIVWMRMWIFLPKWMCVVDFILKMKIALWGCGECGYFSPKWLFVCLRYSWRILNNTIVIQLKKWFYFRSKLRFKSTNKTGIFFR